MTVYIVEDSEATKNENRFPFKTTPDGPTYTVPHMQYLHGTTAEYLEETTRRAYNEASLTRHMIALENPEAGEAVKHLTNDQVVKLAEQWAKASTATVGESQASED